MSPRASGTRPAAAPARSSPALRPPRPAAPPPRRASTLAASLPDTSSSPSHRVSTVYRPPSTSPTAELPGSNGDRLRVTVTTCCGSSLASKVAASRSFCTLAGVPYSCAPQAPSTAPVSRSATSQEVAVTAGGGGAPGAITRPELASWSPPTTRAPGLSGGGTAEGRPPVARQPSGTVWAARRPEPPRPATRRHRRHGQQGSDHRAGHRPSCRHKPGHERHTNRNHPWPWTPWQKPMSSAVAQANGCRVSGCENVMPRRRKGSAKSGRTR